MTKKIENMSDEERQAYFANKREQQRKKLQTGWESLEDEQRKAITKALLALEAFDMDYYETYKICDADIPNLLKEALWSMENMFKTPIRDQ